MTRDELTRLTAEANMRYNGDSWPADKDNRRAEAVSEPGWLEIQRLRALLGEEE